MSCDFKPGDEVVCVDASAPIGLRTGLVEGAVYVVQRLQGTSLGTVGVLLQGVALPVGRWPDRSSPTGFVRPVCFSARRFRKVERKTDKLNLTEWLSLPSDFEEPKRTPAKKRERV